jgi:hypothetical protein
MITEGSAIDRLAPASGGIISIRYPDASASVNRRADIAERRQSRDVVLTRSRRSRASER